MQTELENGLKLNLVPVSQPALDEIIADLGGYVLQGELAALSPAELTAFFQAMPRVELQRYHEALRRQTLYCLGFGVADDPPEDAVALLQHLGRDSHIPQIQRAHWLLYVAGMTRADKSNVIGSIMALTRINDGR